MNRRIFLACTLAFGAAGCTIGRTGSDPVHYDLGTDIPSAPKQRLRGTLALDEVVAAGWLQTKGILYRLTYRDAAQLQAYSLSRWAASPAALLTQRLRAALSVPAEKGLAMVADGVPTDRILKVSLEAFEQQVQSATASQAVVSMRSILIDGKTRALIGQRSFRVEEACPSVDAEGAVRGLRTATDRAVGELIAWLASAIRDA
jgi:cholesterol transport system auxiliary component